MTDASTLKIIEASRLLQQQMKTWGATVTAAAAEGEGIRVPSRLLAEAPYITKAADHLEDLIDDLSDYLKNKLP